MHHDLALVDSLTPEAIGEPGRRTFRIIATSGRGKAVVWMEKEQLFQIGVSVKQVISTRKATPFPEAFAADSPPEPIPIESEFKSGEMSLKHDASSDVFTLSAQKMETEDEDDGGGSESVQFSFTRRFAEEMAERALEIVAAGRKPCLLCGGPVDPRGHFCVKVNGHRAGLSET